MANKQPPPEGYDENPEWTDATTKRARRAGEVHAPHIGAALIKRARGRPVGSDKEKVTMRLDRELIAKLRETGPGWQTRVNDALRKVVGL
jgi:uncharacterized protein (DUF4415 family)